MFHGSLNNENQFFSISQLIITVSILLDFYYRFIIVSKFSQLGFELDIDPLKFCVAKFGLLFLLFMSYFLFEKSLLLYSIFLLLSFFFYLPNATLFSLSDGSWKPFIANLIFVGTFFFSTFVKIKFPELPVKRRMIDLIFFLSSILLFLIFLYKFRNKIVFNTLLLKDIHPTREYFTAQMTSGLNYIYHLAVKTILPVSLLYFLIQRKILTVVLIVLILFYLYMISGNKIVYFNSAILILFYLFHFDYVRKIKLFFQFTIVSLLIFPLADHLFFKDPILVGTFVNRFLFIPSLLTQWYFDFFQGHPFYFAESHFFNQYIHSPYDMPVGYLISNTYLHTTDTYANNGVVSDGFMNLGFVGVFIFSFIIAGLFGVINSFKMNSGYFGLYFGYIYMLLSAPLLSCFITGGIMIFLFMAFFLLKNQEEVKV